MANAVRAKPARPPAPAAAGACALIAAVVAAAASVVRACNEEAEERRLTDRLGAAYARTCSDPPTFERYVRLPSARSCPRSVISGVLLPSA